MGSLWGRVLGRLGFVARVDQGATAVEYGLIVSLIAVTIIVSVGAFGSALRGALFGMITSSLPY